MGHSRPLFLHFRLSYKLLTLNNVNKSFLRLDSNPGPLVSEATALSTVSHNCPNVHLCLPLEGTVSKVAVVEFNVENLPYALPYSDKLTGALVH